MKVICLDPEHEYVDLTGNLGGCFVDLMSGEYIINVLEPKTWDENGSPEDTEAPYAFRCSSKLSQHISFLKDFFRSYKNFTDSQLDTIEIMLAKLYEKWNIGDDTDFGRLTPKDYPILSDLYNLMEEEYKHYDAKKKQLYTAELLQEICLGLHSMCKGAESKFFNGHTNITDSSFLTFGVKGLLQASKNVKDAMLFNVLSYMSNELLTNGHTAACIDEFYLFLTNLTAVEYIRNFMKRVRKKDSAVILASQNLEDFNIDGIREYTKPLFSIPTHVFLFNAGNIDSRFYIDTLQLEQSEYNQRADDKTNANILILGNSGQGKSYLLKLIQTILRESGMKVICLDPEHEYVDLTGNLGGCFVDLMSGEYIINVLEPKTWDENGSPEDTEAPYAFRCSSKLSQHISFLKDFFRSYKNFTDSQLDTIEIMLAKLYEKWNIGDDTDFGRLTPKDYPILSDLYNLMEEEYKHYDAKKKQLYTAELLQEICLGLHSMCKGAESKFFNGHTNITDSSFLTFGVKGLLQASKNVKDAMLFNVLSYMSNELLTNGHTAACIDEFYLFLTNLTAVEYIRNFMKRVRKKDSAVILASQNLEDFNIDGIREYTKPLFSIPTHVFLFNAGNIDSRFYIDTLQLEQSEYNLIRYPQRGVCLYKCGNERYNLMVHAPEYKEKLFGSAGGR